MNSLRLDFLFLCIACNLMLTGCFGGKAPLIRSENQQRAETALTRGIRAEQKGNYLEADSLLSEALAISSSIEDFPARTTALINLARLQRLHNDLAKAELYLDQALIAPSSDARVAAEAAHEKALLELSKGNPSQALEWAQRAIAAEQGSLRGARHNLAGRIQLALGNWSAADSFARSALVENRSAAQAEEEANSLRIMGIVARNQKKYAEGVFVLQEALKIDKRIGKSVKIAADLEELAKMSRNAGSLKESALYLERSYDVNFSAGRLPQAILNQEALAGIYTLLGDVPKAAKSRDTARKLAVQSKSQQSSGSSVTIKPSSNP